jgi:hypothetical protein
MRRRALPLMLAAASACASGRAAPEIAGCPLFPADNIWNTRVDSLPVHVNSALYVNTIGTNLPLHPDFGSGDWPPGSGAPMGIPYVVVSGTQPLVAVTFQYAAESDAGPYPIPPDAPIEGGSNSAGDRHILIVDRDHCRLYELFAAYPETGGVWRAGSGAVFDLASNALRPAGWTSADAAGLPILPGLVRYDEAASGAIEHAIRFTAPQTRRAYVWPARHFASSLTAAPYPPMGQRFRLRADYDVRGFSPLARVILSALKRYGMILADNGSSWFLSGAPDERWDNEVLAELKRVKGRDFEAVDVASLMGAPDSAAVRYPLPTIERIGVTEAGTELDFAGLYPGVTYTVERNGDLRSQVWQPVAALVAEGAATNWRGALADGAAAAFFRVGRR